MLAAFVLLLYGLHLLGFGPPWPSFGGAGGSASPSASPSSKPRPGSSASTPAFSASAPFVGSPAEWFADGSDGIVPPIAHPLEGYTAAQVSFAYGMTKRLLVAANLDFPTLLGGAPLAFSRLLTPRQRSYFAQNLTRTGVAPNGGARSTRAWVTSFSPGSLVFVGNVIKVRGSMTAVTANDGGRPVLRIHTDYMFVYPVQRAAQPATRTLIVIQATANADFARWTSPGGPSQAWWFPVSRGVTTGARCDASDGFVDPSFASSAPGQGRPTGAPADPYRLSPATAQVACRTITQP